MRIVLQRVREAAVSVDGREVARIGVGYVLLVGVEEGDDAATAGRMADKVAALRLFPGATGRGFDDSLSAARGAALVVSQFTLMGDVRRGNRPSWAGAASPEVAEPLVEVVADRLAAVGIPVERGVFGAMMDVALVNDGPVTLVLDSAVMSAPRRGPGTAAGEA